jgi:hypothetical protein
MTLTLHLGVDDFPYANSSGKTTGDVAGILEAKYHVMESFYEDLGETFFAKEIEESARNAVTSLINGTTANITLTGQAEDNIKKRFDLFLSQQELDYTQPGIPTLASLKGVNHSFAKPNAKGNPSRPSFVDTGTFRTSFRAWLDKS